MMSPVYRIRIAGQLDARWSEWLGDLTITPLETGETLLSGPLADRAALYGILDRLRDMDLDLIGLEKDAPGE